MLHIDVGMLWWFLEKLLIVYLLHSVARRLICPSSSRIVSCRGGEYTHSPSHCLATSADPGRKLTTFIGFFTIPLKVLHPPPTLKTAS
jgi:hypothetical protein